MTDCVSRVVNPPHNNLHCANSTCRFINNKTYLCTEAYMLYISFHTVLWRRPLCSACSWTAHTWILAVHRSSFTALARTQLPPGRRSLPAAPPVGSIRALDQTEHHVAVAAGRRRRPFVLRVLWLVAFDRCRAHPKLTPSLESIE